MVTCFRRTSDHSRAAWVDMRLVIEGLVQRCVGSVVAGPVVLAVAVKEGKTKPLSRWVNGQVETAMLSSSNYRFHYFYLFCLCCKWQLQVVGVLMRGKKYV